MSSTVGSVTITEDAQPGLDTSKDTLDFSSFTGGGINLDLAIGFEGLFRLPNGRDPLLRVQRVHDSMVNAKGLFDAVPADALTDFAQFPPPAVFAQAMRTATRLTGRLRSPVNLVISNVPGPRQPLYAAGAQLLHYYPVSTIVDGQGLNITVQSYLDTLDFGLVYVGYPALREFEIHNSGTDVLTITDIPSDNPAYSVFLGGNVFPIQLVPLATAVLQVRFSPGSVGAFNGTLAIQSNDPDAASTPLAVAGTGQLPPIAAVAPTSLHEDLLTGETATQQVTLSNTGASDLDWSTRIQFLSATQPYTLTAVGDPPRLRRSARSHLARAAATDPMSGARTTGRDRDPTVGRDLAVVGVPVQERRLESKSFAGDGRMLLQKLLAQPQPLILGAEKLPELAPGLPRRLGFRIVLQDGGELARSLGG